MPEKTVTKEVKEVKDETVLEQSDTKRERKSPVRFSIAVTKAAPREFVVPEGKGTPLGQIPSSLFQHTIMTNTRLCSDV